MMRKRFIGIPIALVLASAIVLLLLIFGNRMGSRSSTEEGPPAALESNMEVIETGGSPKTEPREKWIEEEFAEAGEDIEAAYFLSRIREVTRGGNSSFGAELLRQMKEKHSSSPLFEEAERLVKESKVTRDR